MEDIETEAANTQPTETCEPLCTIAKRDFEKNMESRLGDLGATIDQWLQSVDEAKDQAAQKLEQLNNKRVAATKSLKEVKDCSGEAWTDFKEGAERSFEEVKKAWDELKCGSQKAASRFDKDVSTQ